MPFALLAQSFTPDPDWRFENFNGQNHFINREISDLAMDKNGYIWTSSTGVQRFDGYRTVEFNSFDQLKGGLRDNYTGEIADNNGRIWVSSAGLCYYDDASGKFIYVNPDAKHNLTYIDAFCIQKNYLWFICEFGLAKLDVRTLKISFTSLIKVTDPLCSFLADDNTLVISSREKVYVYNIKEDTYTSNTLIYDHTLVKIFAAAKGGNDIFLGTNYGLFTFKHLKDIARVSAVKKGLAIDDLVFLPQDKEKRYLFLGTEGKGLLIYNTALKKIEFTYLHDNSNPYSLPNNIISRLFVDKKERLWLCTDLGISMMDVFNRQLKIRVIDKDNTDELGINKIARDKYDSTKVWMSSYNQGMICINWKTKQVEKIYNTNPEARVIYDFAQLSKNKWLITTPKKIMEWSPMLGILSQKELPISDSLRLVCNIRRLIMAGNNACFITTNKGLFKYDLATHQVSAASVNISAKIKDPFKYILLDGFYDNGELWITSRSGLFNYNIAEKKTSFYRGKGEAGNYFFFDITKAANNQIVCAAGTGITIFNKKTKSFKVVNSLANLYKPGCASVIGINSTVWIGTAIGILNYNLSNNVSSRAEYETSMMEVFPSSSFAVIGNDVVFGFRNGYAWFTPNLKTISNPSGPSIESVYVNNQAVSRQYDAKSSGQKLVFSHSDNSINIAFTAFLYTDPDHIKFRYKLKGAGSGWQYAGDQRSANYAQLEPGNYTFYVQSGNKNGIWNNNIASVSFVIQPPYWETWWFRVLVVLLIAFILYRLYLYKIKNMQAIEKIRTKIASDFHDDIGSALSSISIFSDLADNQLRKKQPHDQTREIIGHISFYSRAMLEAMDDIIWAVNPQNDHFNDLAVRMREFAIPLLEARNIQFDINIQEEVLDTRIRMEARKNLFLIFKECINNILKHSCCSAMQVTIGRVGNQLELVISDNGKGFDVNAPNNRNGLKNIHKRAAEIDGVINVTTKPDNGTVVKLLVNIK